MTLGDNTRIIAGTLAGRGYFRGGTPAWRAATASLYLRREAGKRVACIEDAVPSFVPAVSDLAVVEATAAERSSRPKPNQTPAPIDLNRWRGAEGDGAGARG